MGQKNSGKVTLYRRVGLITSSAGLLLGTKRRPSRRTQTMSQSRSRSRKGGGQRFPECQAKLWMRLRRCPFLGLRGTLVAVVLLLARCNRYPSSDRLARSIRTASQKAKGYSPRLADTAIR
jgi:hypothetical protein